MLLQNPYQTLAYILGIIIGTIIVALVLYLAVRIIESKTRAGDKIAMIIIIALITVIVLPIIMSAIATVLAILGDSIASIRTITNTGQGRNYLIFLVPVIGFLILLAINKFLLDISWESALWISLLLIFVLYIMFCIVPELSDIFIPNPLTG